MLSDAYMAGLVDGDGSIFISKIGVFPSSKRRRTSYTLMAHVTGQSKEHMEQLKETLGFGNIYRGGLIYRFATSSVRAEVFIRRILPFLWLKKPQAELAIEFRKTIPMGGLKWGVDVKRQEEIYHQMHELNMKVSREFRKNLANSGKPNASKAMAIPSQAGG